MEQKEMNYELTQKDKKKVKNMPIIEYNFSRYANGYVIKRIETTFFNDKLIEYINTHNDKPKEDNKIKLE